MGAWRGCLFLGQLLAQLSSVAGTTTVALLHSRHVIILHHMHQVASTASTLRAVQQQKSQTASTLCTAQQTSWR